MTVQKTFPSIGQILGTRCLMYMCSSPDGNFTMDKVEPESQLLVVSQEKDWFQILDIKTNRMGWFNAHDMFGMYLFCQKP